LGMQQPIRPAIDTVVSQVQEAIAH
jgi:hypothetical protein